MRSIVCEVRAPNLEPRSVADPDRVGVDLYAALPAS
jgi:hypothetical protein